jgi:hypothetical protein
MASGNMHFRDNAFVKYSNGTLGVGVSYHGRLAVIQEVHFVNSRVVDIRVLEKKIRDQSEI